MRAVLRRLETGACAIAPWLGGAGPAAMHASLDRAVRVRVPAIDF